MNKTQLEIYKLEKTVKRTIALLFNDRMDKCIRMYRSE